MLTVTVSGQPTARFEIPFLLLIKHLAVVPYGIRTAPFSGGESQARRPQEQHDAKAFLTNTDIPFASTCTRSISICVIDIPAGDHHRRKAASACANLQSGLRA